MPLKPPHPCNHRGCPELTHSSFCKNHEYEGYRSQSHYYDAMRGSSAQRGYGARHRKWRLLVLHRDPICKGCGRYAATVADHIVALARGVVHEIVLDCEGTLFAIRGLALDPPRD